MPRIRPIAIKTNHKHLLDRIPLGVLNVHLDHINGGILVAKQLPNVRKLVHLPAGFVGERFARDPDLVEVNVGRSGKRKVR